MSNSPVTTTTPEPAWAAFVALDWGSQKHAWILQPADGGKRELGFLDNTPEAVAIWEEMVRREAEDLFALVELAKWCEHRRRDFRQALTLTMRACAGDLSPEDRADLDRRRERLERKLACCP